MGVEFNYKPTHFETLPTLKTFLLEVLLNCQHEIVRCEKEFGVVPKNCHGANYVVPTILNMNFGICMQNLTSGKDECYIHWK